jgi:hypothetical protein
MTPEVIDITIGDQTTLLTKELEKMAVKLDRLWWESLAAGSREAIALGEASQDVHRALLVLQQPVVSVK